MSKKLPTPFADERGSSEDGKNRKSKDSGVAGFVFLSQPECDGNERIQAKFTRHQFGARGTSLPMRNNMSRQCTQRPGNSFDSFNNTIINTSSDGGNFASPRGGNPFSPRGRGNNHAYCPPFGNNSPRGNTVSQFDNNYGGSPRGNGGSPFGNNYGGSPRGSNSPRGNGRGSQFGNNYGGSPYGNNSPRGNGRGSPFGNNSPRGQNGDSSIGNDSVRGNSPYRNNGHNNSSGNISQCSVGSPFNSPCDSPVGRSSNNRGNNNSFNSRRGGRGGGAPNTPLNEVPVEKFISSLLFKDPWSDVSCHLASDDKTDLVHDDTFVESDPSGESMEEAPRLEETNNHKEDMYACETTSSSPPVSELNKVSKTGKLFTEAWQ